MGPGSVSIHPPKREMSSNSRRILKIFENYDANGDGFISNDELSAVMKAVGFDGDIDELLRMADMDGDGKISYPEFVDWLDFDDHANELAEVVASGQVQGEKQKVTADLKASIESINIALKEARDELAATDAEADKLVKAMEETKKVEEQKLEQNRDPAKLEQQKLDHQKLEEQKLEKQRDINDKCKELDELLAKLHGRDGDANSTERLAGALKTAVTVPQM